MKNRKPVVAGRFYSADKAKLLNDLKGCFNDKDKDNFNNNTIAIISPHAGYIYSGKIAADAFLEINPETEFNNIFVIAPSHQCSFNGASLYNRGNYETPLGEVEVNLPLVKKLINEHSVFTFLNQAHQHEHSLEVQLPFLQYWMKTKINIVPMVVGNNSESALKAIAEALKPYFNANNLFVISSDFSHFPDYKGACIADEKTADAIIANDIEKVQKVVNSNSSVSGLSTSACGLAGILTLMYLTQSKEKYRYNKIAYSNSGDVSFGDKDRVVGYWAISVSDSSNEIKNTDLTKHEKDLLINISKESISAKKIISDSYFDNLIPESLIRQCGVFVSVYVDDNLRGCIGRFKSDKPLWQLVSIMSIQSAYNDTRFNSIQESEFDDLYIEISVISPFVKIDSIDDIELGKHGVYVRKGIYSGTFLPQVATKTGWTKEEFLGHCARDKAGLGWDGWRDSEIFIYTAEVFSGD